MRGRLEIGSIARVVADLEAATDGGVIGLCVAVGCDGIAGLVLALPTEGCCCVVCSKGMVSRGACTAGCFMDCCLAMAGYGAETPGRGRETLGILGKEGFDVCILAAGCD